MSIRRIVSLVKQIFDWFWGIQNEVVLKTCLIFVTFVTSYNSSLREVCGLTSQESNLGLGVFSPYSSMYIVQPPPSLDDNGKAKLQK